jgi:hypothetical protein
LAAITPSQWCKHQTPPQLGARFAANRAAFARFADGNLQTLRPAKLPLRQWGRTWSEALSRHQSTRRTAPQRLHPQHNARGRRRLDLGTAILLNTLRYVKNELQISLICLGISDAREAISGEVQLAWRFEELALPVGRVTRNFRNSSSAFCGIYRSNRSVRFRCVHCATSSKSPRELARRLHNLQRPCCRGSRPAPSASVTRA